jgi:pyrroline-5-carboxylate reductase
MQLGFIGTGEITSSIVTGLSSPGVTAHSIWLSPRNSAIANGLANRFRGISVASCNQEVLNHSDTIVIAVRPSAARDVLAELRFRPDHQVISLVSALSLRSLSELVVPAVRIARAAPLPSTAKRLSPTAIYPPIRWPLNSSLPLEPSWSSARNFASVDDDYGFRWTRFRRWAVPFPSPNCLRHEDAI